MPLNRLIPEGTCDESLLADSSVTVTVTAQAGDTTTAESYRTEEAGLHLFRLDTRLPGRGDRDGGRRGVRHGNLHGDPGLEGPAAGVAEQRGGRSSTTFPVVRTSTIGSTSSGPRDPKGVSPQSSGRTARRYSYRPTSRGRYWKPRGGGGSARSVARRRKRLHPGGRYDRRGGGIPPRLAELPGNHDPSHP